MNEEYFEEMTIEELEVMNTVLSNDRAAIKARQRVLNQVLDRKRAEQPRVDSQSAQVNTAGIKSRLEGGE